MKDYYVYIMSNVSRTLYVGVTNGLERRVYEHRQWLDLSADWRERGDSSLRSE